MTPDFVDLSGYDRQRHDPGRGRIVRIAWYLVNALVFHSWACPASAPKRWLLRLFGARVGAGVVVKPRVNIKYPWRLVLGNHVWIGEGVWIDNLAEVRIGDHVCLSQGCRLLTGNHDYRRRGFDLMVAGIVVEDGCWVTAWATVGPGVTMRRGSIVTVGSVLTGDTRPMGIYRGNPALHVRDRSAPAGSEDAGTR